ncbi:hypothetical protein SSRV2_ORF14 [Saccharolobus shibatae rod virus 2]|nr:hypothetical protein [Saccharolobus shibatae filamentous virus 3]WHA35189.1 hypothetical protein SSRV2_ORF14 [Saccharolobus shibatae rod virus 2]
MISNSGLKVPAIGVVEYDQHISKKYLKLQFLYSEEKNDFVEGLIRNGEVIGDVDKKIRFDILYRIPLGEYLLFGIESAGNYDYMVFSICKIRVNADNVEHLIFSEFNVSVENEECIASNVYANQLDKISSENKLIDKMLYIAKFYYYNDVEYLEIPKNESGEHYEWNDLKQSILYLRQPF